MSLLGLPAELIVAVMEELAVDETGDVFKDKSALQALNRTSRHMHDLVTPILFRNTTVRFPQGAEEDLLRPSQATCQWLCSSLSVTSAQDALRQKYTRSVLIPQRHSYCPQSVFRKVDSADLMGQFDTIKDGIRFDSLTSSSLRKCLGSLARSLARLYDIKPPLPEDEYSLRFLLRASCWASASNMERRALCRNISAVFLTMTHIPRHATHLTISSDLDEDAKWLFIGASAALLGDSLQTLSIEKASGLTAVRGIITGTVRDLTMDWCAGLLRGLSRLTALYLNMKLPEEARLNASTTNSVGQILDAIAQLPQLRHLDIRSLSVATSDVAKVTRIPNLRSLKLESVRILSADCNEWMQVALAANQNCPAVDVQFVNPLIAERERTRASVEIPISTRLVDVLRTLLEKTVRLDESEVDLLRVQFDTAVRAWEKRKMRFIRELQ